jgi:glycosyltransferase involved in cell wall biosynthesis
MAKPIVLFILKRREDFDLEKHNSKGLSTGLFNSATFMSDMLTAQGIDARLEVAIDNNCIDRLVTKHRPTHVIIEALWVVPSKFTILSKLHPTVKWIVRLHSELPFLAGEGMAMDWLADYAAYPSISIGVNAPRMMEEVRTYLQIKQGWTRATAEEKVFYLPNFYPQEYKTKEYQVNNDYIDIGCFGAIRPLKNHVMQAVAALKFAEQIGKKLNFHVNVGRVEMKGEPVMNNLRSMFQQLYDRGHRLIANEWTPREGFLELCSRMDIGLQVSFSETFNIVGADIISQGVPLVGSMEIPWLDEIYSARAQYSDEIYRALLLTHNCPQHNVEVNQRKLTEYTSRTAEIWFKQFTGE